MSDTHIFDLTERIVSACISLENRRKTKLPDVRIAAPALVHGFINTRDFGQTKGLPCINRHQV